MYIGISNIIKKQMASLLYLQSEHVIEISIEKVTQQTNGYDSSVFAIAFAASLCYGRNIRSHLWNFFYPRQATYVSICPKNVKQWTNIQQGTNTNLL